MTDKSIFTATRIRGEEKEFLGSVLLSSETDTASEFFRNIIKKDDKDVAVQKTECLDRQSRPRHLLHPDPYAA